MTPRREVLFLVLASATVMTFSSVLSAVVHDATHSNRGGRGISACDIARNSLIVFLANVVLVVLLFETTRLMPLSAVKN